MKISAKLKTVGQRLNVRKSITYPKRILSTKLPSAPPTISAKANSTVLDTFLKYGISETAIVIANDK